MFIETAIANCDTGIASGLSNQILEVLVAKNLLVKVDHPLISCSGRQNNPYLQPEAYKALVAAVVARKEKLHINSCLRTVVQQQMLFEQYQKGWCGIRAAAKPGSSNHESGLAIDIVDPLSWRSHLAKFGWKWLGAWDEMHFDFILHPNKNVPRAEFARMQLLAFQQLYNRHNPKSILLEDGSWGAKTRNAIARSPIDGFGQPEEFKRGHHGYKINELQYQLRQILGTDGRFIALDGHFGGETEKGVRLFQQRHGLTVDGVVGAQTLATIKKVYG